MKGDRRRFGDLRSLSKIISKEGWVGYEDMQSSKNFMDPCFEAAAAHEMILGAVYLCYMPLHPIGYHPSLPQWRPIPVLDRVFRFVEHGRIASPVMPPTSSTYDHAAFQSS